MTVCAAVLAAGAGKRFGGARHKLLAPVGGRPLVRWAIDSALGAGLDSTFVVQGAVDLREVLPEGVELVSCPDWASGQSASLQTAVRAADLGHHSSVVIGLGDQPLVPSAAWRAVAEAEGALVIATFQGVRTPPVKIAKELWAQLPRRGDHGARPLMKLRPELVIEVPCEGHWMDVDELHDLETVSQLLEERDSL